MRRRFSDPSVIRYAFYFADDRGKQEFLADHNNMGQFLGCKELDEQELNNHLSHLNSKNEPYIILHNNQNIICLLHAVRDTLIWQVAYSVEDKATDPFRIWKEGFNRLQQLPHSGYGVSILFVVNVRIPKIYLWLEVTAYLREFLESGGLRAPQGFGWLVLLLVFIPLFMAALRIGPEWLDWIIPLVVLLTSLPIWLVHQRIQKDINVWLLGISKLKPKDFRPEAYKDASAEGPVGYFRQLAEHDFLLLVIEGSEEHHKAIFQCGTFPRLEMQRHKAEYYERLSEEAERMMQFVKDIIRQPVEQRPFSSDQLQRWLSSVQSDIKNCRDNVESAIESFNALVDEYTPRRMEGEIWARMKHRLERIKDDMGHTVNLVADVQAKVKISPTRKVSHPDIKLLCPKNCDAGIQQELQRVWSTLYQAKNPKRAILHLSSLCLNFMDVLFSSVGEKRPSDNLYECLLRAGKGEPPSTGFGILPDEIASYLHLIRTLSNKVRHAASGISITTDDAEIALRAFLRVLQWYYSGRI